MLTRQNSITDKTLNKTIVTITNKHTNKSKIPSLAPYLAEIQRRKKIKSFRERSKKNLYLDSTRSFRIKQKSALSLTKEPVSLTREIPHNYKPHSKQLEQQYSSYLKTVEAKSKAPLNSDNSFYNEQGLRIKGKKDKAQQKSTRRNKFQTLEQYRARSQQGGDLNMYKLSFTNAAKINIQPNMLQQKESTKKVYQPNKKNFRKNKYETLHCSVNTHDVILYDNKIGQAHNQSDGYIKLDKKQSNQIINIEMDKLAERQMSNYYQQITNRQAYRSIQKSTQKYFDSESYRPVKSKNDIEVYLNSLVNPTLQKDLKSPRQTQQNIKETTSSIPYSVQLKIGDVLAYDFQFKNDDYESQDKISQLQEESSNMNLKNSQRLQKQNDYEYIEVQVTEKQGQSYFD